MGFMISNELSKKIKHIRIKTRKLLSGGLVGDYTVKQKGYGLEFEQLREYQVGDDVRFIDWKSTARVNKILLKEYREERNRTVMLLVDLSPSSYFGSGIKRKVDVMAEVASVLAFSAEYTKDNVGLVLFTDEVELYIPPGRGKQHILQVIKQLHTYKPRGRGTSLHVALRHLAQLKRTDTIAFLISDCIDEGYEKHLACVSTNYDLLVVRCLDEREHDLPANCYMQLQDMETEQTVWIKGRDLFMSQQRLYKQNQIFKKKGIDCFDVSCSKSYITDLISFFQRRIQRQ